MATVERDAKERAERRREREKVATSLKEKGNVHFKAEEYEQALEYYTQVLQRFYEW